ncbi:hypothetical protein [Streptomyces sp. I6]|uniref:hypothetical protein n=1 Tax=Streptomyces sp. I6 TaxID=2483113 RepID=UPI0016092149|nr:hypothetical protein [Streptomyces sp. I6]
MTHNSGPIPSGSASAGLPAWLSADAAEWAAARPAPWARPLWSVLALIVAVALAIAVEPAPVCTDAAPCGADWLGMVQTGLALGLPHWYARLPELALVAAPVLAAIVAWAELPAHGTASWAANLAVIAALALGWVSTRARLAARRRQRWLVERAAGVHHPQPEPGGPTRRGAIPVAAGLVLCTVAAGAVVLGLRAVDADERQAARAVPAHAQVTGRDDMSLRVRTDDGRRTTVDAVFPEDYALGSTVTVLEEGEWRRLAAEPYDPFGWKLLTLGAGVPGVSMLAAGVLARLRSATLRGGRVPALRVLTQPGDDGRTRIHAADDTAGHRPVFACTCAPGFPAGYPHHQPAEGAGAGYGDVGLRSSGTALREAVMLGVPYDGGEVALLMAEAGGNPAGAGTAGPVGPPRTGRVPARRIRAAADTESAESAEAESPHDGRVQPEGTAARKPTSRPLRWGPGTGARAAGLALTAGIVSGVHALTGSLAAGGLNWDLIGLLGLLGLVGPAATLLGWRVTADRTGVWLAGPWQVRHVPWEDLRGAVYTGDGSVEIRLPEGVVRRLPGVGWPWAERRLGLRPAHARMVKKIATLLAHPELRPAERSLPRTRGLPLGPALVLLAGLAAVPSLLGWVSGG